MKQRFSAVEVATLGVAAIGASACATVAWSLYEARWPVLRVVELPLLPPASPTLRILHISDLHMTRSRAWTREFIKRAVRVKPDLVISTGDNFSDIGALERLISVYEPLMHLPGIFVFGSNDYYSPTLKCPLGYFFNRSNKNEKRSKDLPFNELRNFFTNNGWIDLNNTAADFDIAIDRRDSAGLLHISALGVDDPHINRDRMPANPKQWDSADLRIGVAHAPYMRVLNTMHERNAQLVCAGHTHGGQVCLPGYGALVTNCDLPTALAGGIYEWPNPAVQSPVAELTTDTQILAAQPVSASESHSMTVHVSRGLGTNKFTPLRLACRPEATLLIVTARQQ